MSRRTYSFGAAGLCLLTGLIWAAAARTPVTYPVGKDTVAVFGDGRFQVLQFGTGKGFLDVQTQKILLYEVSDWCDRGEWVYAVGKDPDGEMKYLLLNCGTGLLRGFPTLEDLPAQDRDDFRRLKPR
jgi:hypothetical protein